MSEPLKNYAQAAKWLGVPQTWLEAKVQAGEVPHTRLGKHVRFTQEHLDAIVRAGERPVTDDVIPAALPGEPRVLRPVRRRPRVT